MRGAIVRVIKVAGISMALFIVFTWRASGQDRFDNVCPSLQNASPPDLLQFLNGVTPDEKNAWCVTWAIHKLGLEPWATQKLSTEHYETAIAVPVKLGIYVSPCTVRAYWPPEPERRGHRRTSSQNWRTFVRNHAQSIVACDFLVVVTTRFRTLYVFLLMEVGTRRVVHCNVTAHPTAPWTLQQLREAIPQRSFLPFPDP